MPFTDGFDRSTRLALGQIRGVRSTQFLGEKDDLDQFEDTTVWDGPVDYTFTDPALARINRISSSDVLDAGKQILIAGLNEDWDEVTQVATLTGQSKVILDPELIRVNSAQALQNLVGDIYIYEDGAITLGIPDDLTTVKGYIDPLKNIAKSTIFSIPRNHIFSFKIAMYATAPSALCCMRFRNYATLFGGATLLMHSALLTHSGSTFQTYKAESALTFPSKADLSGRVNTTTPGSAISVVVDGELIEVS
jgi:hypothetical protein